MIVDSSIIVAILRGEPEAERFGAVVAANSDPVISAGNYLEASIVIDKDRDAVLSAKLDALLNELEIEIVPVTAAQAKLARQAYRDFGKGSGHPAKLNFGDCFAYDLARANACPLLFVGNDFSKIDIKAAG